MSATYTRVSGDYNIVSVDPTVDNVNITTNSLNLTGNLHVSGNITYINVEDLTVDDPFITVAGNNSGTLGTAPFQQQGLVARTSLSTYAGLRFDNGTQQWQLSNDVYANGAPFGNSYATIVTGNAGSGSSIANGTSSVAIATADGNIVATANGNAVLTITEFGANFVGATNLGNAATANYFIGDGSLLTNITVSGGTAIVNGNSNVNVSANSAVRIGVAGVPDVAVFTPLNVNFNALVTAPTFEGNSVTGNYIFGNGSGLSAIVGANVTGVVPYANMAYSVALANVSGIGNIASINLDGNASNVLYGNGVFAPATGGVGNYGNSNVAGFLAAFGSNTILTTGNVSVGSLTASGVSGVTGNLTVANIQVDTNKSIDVGNNRIMNVGYPTANTDAVTKAYVDSQVSSGFTVQDDTANTTAVAAGGTLELLGTANEVTVAITNTDQITFGLPDNVTITANITAGNANLGNAATANYFIGNGSLLTSITASNVSGQVANALVAGTVYTNAQPNITSVGSLSGLTVSNASGVVNFVTTANVALGNVSNLHITGGSNGQVLTTDGAGGLSWSTSGNGGGGNSSSISNGTSNVDIATSSGNVTFGVGGNANVATVTGTGINVVGLNVTGLSNLGSVGNVTITGGTSGYVLSTNGAGSLSWVAPGGAGNVIGNAVIMGTNTLGNLVSNAVTLTTSTSVTDGITQLNAVLGKLVPPSPPNFPASQSIAVASLSTYRMTNYTQTDNTPGANKSVAGGTTVSTVRRASSYSTNSITTAGPGDSGTIAVKLNGADAGNRTLTSSLNGNGTYSNLTISNNYDYNTANPNVAAGFWSVFTSSASGTVPQGWNEVYISDSAASNTNTYSWFYDSSAPGTPAFSSLGIAAPGSPSYVYSSTVPHYDNTNAFSVTFNVNKLSGNMYPTSDTFVTGSAGGAFGAPASVTYAGASITTPLAQNLYVSTGNASVSTTSTVISGFGASTTGPSISVVNSYNTGTQAFTTTLNANVLYKTGTVSSASRIEEANVFVGTTVGVGSGLAFRITNPGSTNTPVYTGSEAAFNSQTGPLQTYDSTVVANVLKHDQTNYATGYLPAGPNLSAGRTGTQYFTFKIVRTSVSKFDVKWSGNIAGLWVALPGSTIDSTSSANGWIDMSSAYLGSGIPGVNSPGNGSDGCALGGVAPLNSVQTNKAVTATFGTVSSSSTATNEIYIRLALTSGQSVTALSLQTASN